MECENQYALNVSDNNFHQELLEQVHKPQNALMHQKMERSLLAEINLMITALIKEGIEQGICQTDYPEEVAEMTFLYANTVFDDLMEHSEEERLNKPGKLTEEGFKVMKTHTKAGKDMDADLNIKEEGMKKETNI